MAYRVQLLPYNHCMPSHYVLVPKILHSDVCGQIPKSIYQVSYLLPSDFPNNFSQARSYLNRMKDC